MGLEIGLREGLLVRQNVRVQVAAFGIGDILLELKTRRRQQPRRDRADVVDSVIGAIELDVSCRHPNVRRSVLFAVRKEDYGFLAHGSWIRSKTRGVRGLKTLANRSESRRHLGL